MGGPEAVEDLNFVKAVKVDSGIRSFCEHEFDVELNVAEFLFADQIYSAASEAIENAVARFLDCTQAGWAEKAIPPDAFGGEPLVWLAVHSNPAGEIRSVEQGLPSVFDQERRVAVRFAIVEIRMPLGL